MKIEAFEKLDKILVEVYGEDSNTPRSLRRLIHKYCKYLKSVDTSNSNGPVHYMYEKMQEELASMKLPTVVHTHMHYVLNRAYRKQIGKWQ